MIYSLTGVAIVALVASIVRCVILASLTRQRYREDGNYSSTTITFDIIHSFIQGVHVLEYIALLYGIAGFYLYSLIKKDDIKKYALNQFCECTNYACIGVVMLCGLGLTIFLLATFVPIAILTNWPFIIAVSKNFNESSTLADVPKDTALYIAMAYVSHSCHSFTRISMICVTVVVRSAWLYQPQPKQRRYNTKYEWAVVLLSPKWLNIEVFRSEDQQNKSPDDLKKNFKILITNYNNTGCMIAPLHGIFQQWFVVQWIVYFIKIIEDFTVSINGIVKKEDISEPKMLFVITHLVYDIILFIIPYYCASLMNQCHNDYHRRLQSAQNEILCDDMEGWRLQHVLSIPKNPFYIFIPSFCGLSIPLSSPGYNLSIILALFAIIISM